MHTIKSAILALMGAVFVIGTPIFAQSPTLGEEVPEFDQIFDSAAYEFELAPDIPPGPETELINGTLVSSQQFPSVLRMVTGGTCTASLVGPASMILAAHCMPNGARISFKIGTGTVTGKCIHNPGFQAGDWSKDIALCLLRHKVTNVTYETLAIGAVPSIGSTIHLSGYGCTQKGVRSDKKLRVGTTELVGRPNGVIGEANTIFTFSEVASGEAVLCPGDSGGPAFFIPNGNLDGERKIVGVNSRTTYELGFGFLASVAKAGNSG
ncbi:MAG: trypsin-like serine protease, partial [Rhizobiaceae bacterium]|nr:trypsin-like serine protease [Rhizobiaceae bacterium]